MSEFEKQVNSIKFWRAIDNGVFKYAEWLKNRSDEDYDTILRGFLNFAESTRWKFDDRIIKFVQAVVTVAHVVNKPLKNAVYAMAEKLKNRNDSISPEEEAKQKLANKELARRTFSKAKGSTRDTKLKRGKANIIQEEENMAKKKKTGSSDPFTKQLVKKTTETGKKPAQKKDSNTQYEEFRKSHRIGNDPNWYTDLGIHTEFNVPDGWSDSIAIPITSGSGLPIKDDLTVLRMLYNINADKNARIERAFQKFTLLKGIRGLSSVPYNVYDIFHYDNAMIFMLNEYYAFLSVVKAATLYEINKSKWPRTLVLARRFNFYDVVFNLADCKEFILNLARTITTLPITGHLHEKLAYLNLSLIPDSDDLAVATYYTHDVLIDDSAVCLDPIYDNTDSLTSVLPASGGGQPYPGRSNLASWMVWMDYAFRAIKTSKRYSLIVGDMIGAFGKASVFTPDYEASTLLLAKYNEMNLSQIQNTSVCNFQGEAIVEETSQGQTVVKFIPDSRAECVLDDGAYSTNQTISVSNYTSWLDDGCLVKTDTISTTWNGSYVLGIRVPALPGFKGGTLGTPVGGNASFERGVDQAYFWDQDVLNKYFYKGSEGELLDVANNRAMLKRIAFNVSSGSPQVCTINQWYEGISMVCFDIIVYHYNFYNDQYINKRCVNTSIAYSKSTQYTYPGYGVSERASDVTSWLDVIPMATQMDWFPLINVCIWAGDIDKNDNNYNYDQTLFDWNIVGIYGRAAFLNAKKYVTYSLNAQAKKASGKTIENIQAVYNDKA